MMHVNLGERGPFLTMRAEGWDRFMAANLGMLFYCSHRAAKIMARKRRAASSTSAPTAPFGPTATRSPTTR